MDKLYEWVFHRIKIKIFSIKYAKHQEIENPFKKYFELERQILIFKFDYSQLGVWENSYSHIMDRYAN